MKIRKLNAVIREGKKKIIVAVLMSIVIIIGICFSGCSEKITEGTVYKRNFVAEHTETMMIPIVHSTGKTSFTTIIPMIRTYPDEYIISIKKYDTDSKDWETADYYVSQEVYDKVKVGDYYVFDDKDGTADEPYTQEEKK